MTNIFDAWDAKRAPAASTGQPVTPRTQGGGTAYGLAALAGEVDNLLAVPVGSGRNDQLNRSAVKMYGLAAAGALDENTVTETLGAADGGLDHPATRRTLQSAREAVYGRLGARNIPEPTHPVREVMPWEQSDDPFSEHYVAPPAGSGTPGGHSAHTSGSHSAAPSGTPCATAESSTTALDAASTSTEPQAGPSSDALVDLEALQVAAEVRKQRVTRQARKLIDAEDALRDFREPDYTSTLTDELAIPAQPVAYRVDKLIPNGANVLFAAQFKAGKTTGVTNLARSLVDGDSFLGRYAVEPFDGRVGIFNYEVSRDQYREWLREVGFTNTDKVTTLPLRGFRLDLRVPYVETWVVEWLKRHEVTVWIVDPFARAATGIDENSNTEVGQFLDTLDVIKARAGVSELILPTHTGRAEQEQGDERARGATRLDDWADVRWLLTRDKNDTRYFRATGRDVDTDEAALKFDPKTRHLTITGGDRYTVERDAYRDAVLTIVGNRPGVNARDLRDGVRQILRRASAERVKAAVDDLVDARRIHTIRAGHAVGHHLGAPPHGAPPDAFA